ncbi:helix-turn-helix domain-containing protein [Legionella pneumophila]|uniref:helix-turn-helix domain-containing protein n=1 Tax=Legionella pneumophila TaxID=446 RepID=UPI000492008C|nr:XRE family transcriptional regulator [Legionella pneumophila]HAT1867498.1 helix-turn-helix domain-containing protein [Legionella pneumophila]HAT1907628.1 helix-turn-helix domain-containing protein [Legionella pneumophila]HAT1916478.1 helix-turn-helix domain-containing protein [Legionella pneumophila]HAT1984446.1 helix-turn-helix domain-containing protein [Legionella pneumophila]HCR5299923.1 helix-turn-helix domain-containing protein [Legionella pneumophila]
MNIKKEIGKRILEARKAKGLTLKALGELAGGLKQTRLTNWEQGVRTPGPEEIKQLAEALNISPAYLMCLSDETGVKEVRSYSQLIPLLDYQHVVTSDRTLVSVSTTMLSELSSDAFALKITDDSMKPEIRVNDVLVIDPSVSPAPGDFVAVKIAEKAELIICQYKKLSYTSTEFELLTLNDNWPNIKVNDGIQVNIIGKVVQNIRSYF